MDVSLSNPWEIVRNRETWHAAVHGVTKIQIQISDLTTTTWLLLYNNHYPIIGFVISSLLGLGKGFCVLVSNPLYLLPDLS